MQLHDEAGLGLHAAQAEVVRSWAIQCQATLHLAAVEPVQRLLRPAPYVRMACIVQECQRDASVTKLRFGSSLLRWRTRQDADATLQVHAAGQTSACMNKHFHDLHPDELAISILPAIKQLL